VSLHHWPVERKPTRVTASAEEISSLDFPRGFFESVRWHCLSFCPQAKHVREQKGMPYLSVAADGSRRSPVWLAVWSRKAWRDVKAEGGGGTHAATTRHAPSRPPARTRRWTNSCTLSHFHPSTPYKFPARHVPYKLNDTTRSHRHVNNWACSDDSTRNALINGQENLWNDLLSK
jgi:hypothetical protein